MEESVHVRGQGYIGNHHLSLILLWTENCSKNIKSKKQQQQNKHNEDFFFKSE